MPTSCSTRSWCRRKFSTGLAGTHPGLLPAGRSPLTPVGIFARATRADAVAVVGVLDDLPALAAAVETGPAMLFIGDVVAHSAPWQTAELTHLASNLMMAAE